MDSADELEGGSSNEYEEEAYTPKPTKRRKSKPKGLFNKLFSSNQNNGVSAQTAWDDIKHNKAQRKARIDYLWNKARRYNNKLRL